MLFNDPEFLEPARVLAENLVREFPSDDAARCVKAFRLFTGKMPEQAQTDVLVRMIQDSRKSFKAYPTEAANLRTKNGETPVDASLDAAEVAATTIMARALIGYDETVMKP